MKKCLTTIISAMLTVIMLTTSLAFSVDAADNAEEFDITAFDSAAVNSGITVYPNETDKDRVIGASEYGFRYSKLLIFDKDGWLIEAGGDLLANENGVNGSPQLTVTVPAGGFMVAYGSGAPQGIKKCYDTAMEGAMLYNATMSVIYKVKGSYNKITKKLKIEYDNPKPASKDAKKYLFVGNSSTYFNGTPIKFKALAQAAGVEIDVVYSTFGSAYLSEFADENHERGKFLRNKLNTEKFDYVVLQDASAANYSSTNAAVEILLPLIEKNGAEALLYMRYGTEFDFLTKHHNNYSRIAEERDLLCAPAADAYMICRETYPDINLYADDGGHHSKEGSYLIACVWLYSYLGKDPRGNEYTAQLPDGVAEKLQEIAYKACQEGYDFPEDDRLEYSEDGVKYKNLAEDKKYVPSGSPYNGDWTDTNADGTPIGKLTDGVLAQKGDDQAVGCYTGSAASITIDLEKVCAVKAVKTDLYGNSSWGIPDPSGATVKIEVSLDGTDFEEIGEAAGSDTSQDGNWVKRNFEFSTKEAIDARYVRVTYVITGNFCWSSEIGVFGIDDEEGAEGDKSEVISENIESEESIEQDKIEEPANKKFTWLYIAIGVLVIAAVIAAAVILSKKK